MTAHDPHPEFRCRCVSWLARTGWQDDFRHRCPTRPTAEDGLCDHCRQPHGACGDAGCNDPAGTVGIGCCRQPYATGVLVPLTTPCEALPQGALR